MIRYFVLWTDEDDRQLWDGPFSDFEETADLDVRQDPGIKSFVTMTENYHP